MCISVGDFKAERGRGVRKEEWREREGERMQIIAEWKNRWMDIHKKVIFAQILLGKN